MTDEFIRTKLFRPFATTKKKGLGLGLYQSRAIVQAHGGELRARSVPGKGSVFEVALNVVSTPEPGASNRAPMAPAPERTAR
jgi:signal transduction histidine kinase